MVIADLCRHLTKLSISTLDLFPVRVAWGETPCNICRVGQLEFCVALKLFVAPQLLCSLILQDSTNELCTVQYILVFY